MNHTIHRQRGPTRPASLVRFFVGTLLLVGSAFAGALGGCTVIVNERLSEDPEDGAVPDTDGGSPDAPDAERCTSNADCNRSEPCRGVCDPDSPSANVRGCLPEEPVENGTSCGERMVCGMGTCFAPRPCDVDPDCPCDQLCRDVNGNRVCVPTEMRTDGRPCATPTFEGRCLDASCQDIDCVDDRNCGCLERCNRTMSCTSIVNPRLGEPCENLEMMPGTCDRDGTAVICQPG
jgi:hypothetical protein